MLSDRNRTSSEVRVGSPGPRADAAQSSEIAYLRSRVERLEYLLGDLLRRPAGSDSDVSAAAIGAADQPGRVCETLAENQALALTDPSQTRRGLFVRGGLGALAGAAGVALVSSDTALAAGSGSQLYTNESFGNPVVPPALMSSVVWTNTDPAGLSLGQTSETLSLITECTQTNSYAWPIYVELRATTSPSATKDSSNNGAVNVRLYNGSSGGSPWSVGYHSEVHHGQNNTGDVQTTYPSFAGTSLGVNVEVTRMASAGFVAGLEVNSLGSSYGADAAIDINGDSNAWNNGIQFRAPGNIGINFVNQWENGHRPRTEQHQNGWGPEDHSRGVRDDVDRVNPSSGKIEFYKYPGRLVWSI